MRLFSTTITSSWTCARAKAFGIELHRFVYCSLPVLCLYTYSDLLQANSFAWNDLSRISFALTQLIEVITRCRCDNTNQPPGQRRSSCRKPRSHSTFMHTQFFLCSKAFSSFVSNGIRLGMQELNNYAVALCNDVAVLMFVTSTESLIKLPGNHPVNTTANDCRSLRERAAQHAKCVTFGRGGSKTLYHTDLR